MKSLISLIVLFGTNAACSYGASSCQTVDQPATSDVPCTNGPNTRACWKDGFSIDTDFDTQFPITGNTVSYYLKLTNTTCNPDGHGERVCLLVNDQYPGPTIRASWGDIVQVTVENALQHNGTSIHFHGVRQFNSNGEDGVNGVTECALAPNHTKTYTFQATQFGTGWYHSHFSDQYGDGVIGPIVFEGPASANYDIDLGPYMLNEWYYMTTFQANSLALANLQSPNPGPAQAPPISNNILINGTNKDAEGNGKYNQVSIVAGKRYLLRLINSSVDQFFRVSLDNHTMQVVAADFCPVKPVYTKTLLMNVAQRYDVIIDANQPPGNYWFRVSSATECVSLNQGQGLAVWTYEGVEPQTPTTTGHPTEGGCVEPSYLAPYWEQPVPSSSFASTAQTLNVSLTNQVITNDGDSVFVWALGNSSLNLDLGQPTLSYIMDGNSNYPNEYSVIPTVSEGGWNYWIVQQTARSPPIPHPVHLHGHDFFVLGQGIGEFDISGAQLNWDTPMRRDTATMPAGGWLALAFTSDNPGAWLMHCHTSFHVSEGFAIQFLESPSRILMPNRTAYDQVCNAWKEYRPTAYYKKVDSGV